MSRNDTRKPSLDTILGSIREDEPTQHEIEAAADRVRAKLGFDAGSVEKIICRMPPGGMRVLTYPRPATGLEGKFSLPYTLAAGALDGKYSLDSFTDAAVRRKEIEALYARMPSHGKA